MRGSTKALVLSPEEEEEKMLIIVIEKSKQKADLK